MTKLAAIRFYFFLDEMEKIAQAQANPEAMEWMRRMKQQHAQQYGLTGLDPVLMAKKQRAQRVLGDLPTAGDMPDPAQTAARRKALESRMQREGMVSQKGWTRPDIPAKRTSGPPTPFETGRGRVVPATKPATVATAAATPKLVKKVAPKATLATKALKILRRVA